MIKKTKVTLAVNTMSAATQPKNIFDTALNRTNIAHTAIIQSFKVIFLLFFLYPTKSKFSTPSGIVLFKLHNGY